VGRSGEVWSPLRVERLRRKLAKRLGLKPCASAQSIIARARALVKSPATGAAPTFELPALSGLESLQQLADLIGHLGAVPGAIRTHGRQSPVPLTAPLEAVRAGGR